MNSKMVQALRATGNAAKRAPRSAEAKLEETAQQLGSSPLRITPKAIRLKVGWSSLEIPQGTASRTIWTTANVEKVALFIHDRCPESDLAQVELGTMAQIVEHATQLVEDQQKLSARFTHLEDTIHEAHY